MKLYKLESGYRHSLEILYTIELVIEHKYYVFQKYILCTHITYMIHIYITHGSYVYIYIHIYIHT